MAVELDESSKPHHKSDVAIKRLDFENEMERENTIFELFAKHRSYLCNLASLRYPILIVVVIGLFFAPGLVLHFRNI